LVEYGFAQQTVPFKVLQKTWQTTEVITDWKTPETLQTKWQLKPNSHFTVCQMTTGVSTASVLAAIQNTGAAPLLRCNLVTGICTLYSEFSCVHNFMFLHQQESQYVTSFSANFFMPQVKVPGPDTVPE
jgi:hypothetical protein